MDIFNNGKRTYHIQGDKGKTVALEAGRTISVSDELGSKMMERYQDLISPDSLRSSDSNSEVDALRLAHSELQERNKVLEIENKELSDKVAELTPKIPEKKSDEKDKKDTPSDQKM